MGMENDNHVTMTWAEMQEQAAKEKAEAEARAKEIDPCKLQYVLSLIEKRRQSFF